MSRGAQRAFDAQQENNRVLQANALAQSKNVAAEAAAIPADLTPAQREAILRAQLGGIDIGYENAANKAERFASRTGAIGGMPELISEQTRQAARDKSEAAARLEAGFTEIPVERARERASIYGLAAGTPTNLYGASTRLSGELAQQAFAPSWWQNAITAAAGGAGAILKAAKGGPPQ